MNPVYFNNIHKLKSFNPITVQDISTDYLTIALATLNRGNVLIAKYFWSLFVSHQKLYYSVLHHGNCQGVRFITAEKNVNTYVVCVIIYPVCLMNEAVSYYVLYIAYCREVNQLIRRI